MRRAIWLFTLVFVVALGPAAWAQDTKQDKPERPDAAPSKNTSSSAKTKPEQNPNGTSVRAGTKISAELATNLDARTAKPGDEVVARVTKDVKQDGRVVIRKGDQLLGHVTGAEASSSAQAGSNFALAFDRLQQGKSVTELSTAITQVVAAQAAAPEPMPDMGSQVPMGQAPMGGSRSGGGGSGGLVGGATSTVGHATTSTLGTAGSTVQGVGNTGVAGSATSQTSAGANGSAGLATPINNIHLGTGVQGSSQSQATSVLSTKNGDLRINSGTRMEFRVAGQSQAEVKNKK